MLPGVLSRLYNNGENLFDTILYVTRGTPIEGEVADCLISPADSTEYSALLMKRSFVALSPDAPPITEHLRLGQQSTQAEVTDASFFDLFCFAAS